MKTMMAVLLAGVFAVVAVVGAVPGSSGTAEAGFGPGITRPGSTPTATPDTRFGPCITLPSGRVYCPEN